MEQKLRKFWIVALLGFFVAAFVPSLARAETVQLTLASVSGAPGSELTVLGTITNNSSATVYLNGENFTLSSASFLNGDTTNFFLNAPLSLDPGTNSGSIALFAFDIAPGTPAGIYPGNFLDIIGGGPSDFTDVLASAEFSVNVQGATPASEPSALILILVGGFAYGAYLLRKKVAIARRTPDLTL